MSKALAHLVSQSTRGLKLRGRTIRCKLGVSTFATSAKGADAEAVRALVKDGHSVRLFEANNIFDARVDAKDVLVWDQSAARRDREYVTVEVTL